MNPLKIGFVLDDSLDSTDGVQQYVLGLGGWLTDQGHDVHYLVGKTTRTDPPNIHSLSHNWKVRFNGNRMSMPLPASRRLIQQLLQDQKFDVLHVQMPYSPLLAQRIIALAPPTTAVVGTFHIAPISNWVRQANHLLAAYSRRSLARFDDIMSVSTAARAFAQEAYGISSTIVPNPVKVEKFALARPFERTKAVPRIVYLGRLVPRKGCRILLEAVDRLVGGNVLPDIEVVICGGGPLEDELKAFVRSKGLENVVTFAGYVTETDKARHLKSADLAVFPSTGGESFGIVLIEAMAAQRPVVLGAANPGYTAVLGPYPDLLFPVNDAPALARLIDHFLTNQESRQRALEWQRARVAEYDIAEVGGQVLKIYGNALRGRADMR